MREEKGKGGGVRTCRRLLFLSSGGGGLYQSTKKCNGAWDLVIL